jgi:hypothetical protein
VEEVEKWKQEEGHKKDKSEKKMEKKYGENVHGDIIKLKKTKKKTISYKKCLWYRILLNGPVLLLPYSYAAKRRNLQEAFSWTLINNCEQTCTCTLNMY